MQKRGKKIASFVGDGGVGGVRVKEGSPEEGPSTLNSDRCRGVCRQVRRGKRAIITEGGAET